MESDKTKIPNSALGGLFILNGSSVIETPSKGKVFNFNRTF
jgi:hypothetical protein